MNTESPPEGSGYTGKDIPYREGATGFFDVQRAADALLRQGRKPSVAGIREQLGGGSPNTITPLLARYWQKLGERLAEGPEALERVPEALARVTELLWRRALEEARERLKLLQQPDHKPGAVEQLQEQIGKLSMALAEARARQGEQVTQLARLTREQADQRLERTRLIALLRGAQALQTRPENIRESSKRLPKKKVLTPRRRSLKGRAGKRRGSKVRPPSSARKRRT